MMKKNTPLLLLFFWVYACFCSDVPNNNFHIVPYVANDHKKKILDMMRSEYYFLNVRNDQEALHYFNLYEAQEQKNFQVLLKEQDIIGFAASCKTNSAFVWYIPLLFVADGFRGQGAGKILLQFTIDQIKKDEKAKLINISVLPDNIIAQNLYQKTKFKQKGEYFDTHGKKIVVLGLRIK